MAPQSMHGLLIRCSVIAPGHNNSNIFIIIVALSISTTLVAIFSMVYAGLFFFYHRKPSYNPPGDASASDFCEPPSVLIEVVGALGWRI